MDGLIKLMAIMIFLYGMGKLGPKTRRRMEKFGRRLRGLFCTDEAVRNDETGDPISR